MTSAARWRQRIGVAVLAAGACAASAVLRHGLDGRDIGWREIEVIGFLVIGALVGTLVGAAVADRLGRGRHGLRLALLAVLVPSGVFLTAALLAGIHFYLNAYGPHDSLLTPRGLFQLAFTVAQGAFYFAVFAARLYWPLAVLAQPLVVWLLLRRPARAGPAEGGGVADRERPPTPLRQSE